MLLIIVQGKWYYYYLLIKKIKHTKVTFLLCEWWRKAELGKSFCVLRQGLHSGIQWTWTLYVAKDDPELLRFLPRPRLCWHYSVYYHIHLAYAMPETGTFMNARKELFQLTPGSLTSDCLSHKTEDKSYLCDLIRLGMPVLLRYVCLLGMMVQVFNSCLQEAEADRSL